MKTLLLVSVAERDIRRLTGNGPRRDFLELAQATGGDLRYASAARSRSWRGKLLGPHVRQAWHAAAELRNGDTAFADGEHVGLPLLVFLALRARRRVRVVMLGHLVDRRWKRVLLSLASRAVPGGVLVVHSAIQRDIASRALAANWSVELVPYQVDSAFWQSAGTLPSNGTILAVGSENRDYTTLCAAVDGLPHRVVIAAGSHWARRQATAEHVPANVEFLTQTLDFSALRQAYEQASLVVVPLHDVLNQSGITTLLEAMSMRRPVVVTASRGQRESVQGPLIRADGASDSAATSDRGPAVFGDAVDSRQTGYYAAPGDPASLRAAIQAALADPATSATIGQAARDSIEAHFTLPRYVNELSGLLSGRDARSPVALETQPT